MKYSFELQLCYYPLWCQFQFSSKMFLTFLLTEILFFWALQKEAGGWTGRDRQKEKDEKRSKYFPFILIYFHTLRIREITDRKQNPSTSFNAHVYQNTPRCYGDLQKIHLSLHYLFLFYLLSRWRESQLPFFSSPYSYQTNNRNIHNSFSNNINTDRSLSSCLSYSGTKLAWAQGAFSADNGIPVGKWFCSSEPNSNFPIVILSFQSSWRSWSSTPEMMINSLF